MSRRSVEENPFIQRQQAIHAAFKEAYPHLYSRIAKWQADFRGLTVFVGETSDTVVGLRIFNEDGKPVVCWSSGEDFFTALSNLDRGVGANRFKDDKHAVK